MNPEIILNQIESALLNCTDRDVFRYCLVYKNDKFEVIQARKALISIQIVCQLTRQQIEKGLTTAEWNCMLSKVAYFFKDKKP